jgi:hypothetical protein
MSFVFCIDNQTQQEVFMRIAMLSPIAWRTPPLGRSVHESGLLAARYPVQLFLLVLAKKVEYCWVTSVL